MDDAIRTALETERTIDITTTGRRSGLPRRIEIWFHNVDGEVYITGLPGERDWYANLMADPAITLHLKQSVVADLTGKAVAITDPDEKLRALKIITDHVVANWDEGRPVSEIDNKKTLVLEMPLTEASAKIRSGDPIDEPDDMAGPWWSGVIPVETRFGEATAAADFTGSNPMPTQYGALAGKTPDER